MTTALIDISALAKQLAELADRLEHDCCEPDKILVHALNLRRDLQDAGVYQR